MPIVSWRNVEPRPRSGDPSGYSKPFVNPSVGAECLRMHVSCVSPGMKPHPPHQHPEEEIMYVLEGRGTMLLGDELAPVEAESAIFVPSNQFHGIENTGDTSLRYMVILEAPR